MARAGRKPLPYPRTKSGKISRARRVIDRRAEETEKAAMHTAISARVRLFGVPEADAKQGEAGSVIGRMKLRRELRPDQHEAAHQYLRVRMRYQMAIGAAPDFGEPREGFPASDDPEKAHKAFCAAAVSEWRKVQDVQRQVMQEQRSPDPVSALDVFLVKDAHDARLIGPLRIMLNALGRLWGIPVVRVEQEVA